ncbi:hypothetical protein B0H16DRAFT_1460553 [Mycena metata]|uniref:Uncharacterized protein n=1 Tax=Mycena metata TaxID=1033252 RepID=A0AAD7IUV9_9AGAR|nr:hypothetical protein B0H16DRAFT_1460553 [Mycena metata]
MYIITSLESALFKWESNSLRARTLNPSCKVNADLSLNCIEDRHAARYRLEEGREWEGGGREWVNEERERGEWDRAPSQRCRRNEFARGRGRSLEQESARKTRQELRRVQELDAHMDGEGGEYELSNRRKYKRRSEMDDDDGGRCGERERDRSQQQMGGCLKGLIITQEPQCAGRREGYLIERRQQRVSDV